MSDPFNQLQYLLFQYIRLPEGLTYVPACSNVYQNAAALKLPPSHRATIDCQGQGTSLSAYDASYATHLSANSELHYKDCTLRTPRFFESLVDATCPEPAQGEEAANSALAFLGMCAVALGGSAIRISGGTLGVSCRVRIVTAIC